MNVELSKYNEIFDLSQVFLELIDHIMMKVPFISFKMRFYVFE